MLPPESGRGDGMSRSKGYKCFNIKCGSCIGKTLCGEPEDTALGCVGRVVGKPMTNADCIRARSDEELAEFLWNFNPLAFKFEKCAAFFAHHAQRHNLFSVVTLCATFFNFTAAERARLQIRHGHPPPHSTSFAAGGAGSVQRFRIDPQIHGTSRMPRNTGHFRMAS